MCNEPSKLEKNNIKRYPYYSQSVCVKVWRISCSTAWLRCDDSTQFFFCFLSFAPRDSQHFAMFFFLAAVSLYEKIKCFMKESYFFKIFNSFLSSLRAGLEMPTHNNFFFGAARLVGAVAIKQHCRIVSQKEPKQQESAWQANGVVLADYDTRYLNERLCELWESESALRIAHT